MLAENIRTMERYLDLLVEGGDLTEVPMHPDLRFRGPLASTQGAEVHRTACLDLAAAVRGVRVRTMVGGDDVVHAVYDLDLGLASGPLATAQTVRFRDGALAEVDVVFDAASITGSAS